MPVQNHGTLLENIVLVEAGRLLCRRTAGTAGPLEFANAFVLPPMSEWRGKDRYANQPGMRDERLDRLLATETQDDASYGALLSRCLRSDRGRGPNGALLVALLLRQADRSGRLWLNDLTEEDARYEGTVAELGHLHAVVDELSHDAPEETRLQVTICTTAYPESMPHLAVTLAAWREAAAPVARLGFLDPDNYTTGGRVGPQTSSADHRSWLATLKGDGRTFNLAVHFSGDCKHAPPARGNHLAPCGWRCLRLRGDAGVPVQSLLCLGQLLGSGGQGSNEGAGR
jgi:hypothetical protein